MWDGHRRPKWAAVRLLALALGSVLATAGARAAPTYTVYGESFDAATQDQLIATLNTYPDFRGILGQNGGAVVAGNVLRLLPGSISDSQCFLRPGPGGATAVSAKVGAVNSDGLYSVGLRVGQNDIVFHPGFGGAALRVEGPGGFGNTNVGFTPANGVLHTLEVTDDGSGAFNVTLTNGATPANSWSGSFFNPGSVGGAIGLLRANQPIGPGLFGELTVGTATEPFSTDTQDGTSRVFRPDLADGSVSVGDGRLTLASGGGSTSQTFVRSGLKRDHTLIAMVGADASSGTYGVGLQVGPNNVVFHPGYGGGALRVEGPGGFGNTNVGFTPANGVAHELRVKADGRGQFQVTLIDGANPANTFTGSFTNPGSIGGDWGPYRSGPATGVGFCDSLSIEIEDRPVVVSHLFDLNADTDLAYPDFVDQAGTGRAFVADGRLVLAPRSGTTDLAYARHVAPGPCSVSARVSADASGGSYSVGLRVGQNDVVFHPGYGGGALRVEGPGGFGNTNVGFTPANGVLHVLEVTGDGSGTFSVTLTDGANPANVWSGSFFNPGSVGGPVGPLRQGPTVGVGLFDDLTINAAPQSFDTDTDVRARCGDFVAALAGGHAVVAGGVLELAPPRGADSTQTFLTAGLTGEFALSALISADTGDGSYGVGLTIGENNILFSPGMVGVGLRVEGPGGFGNLLVPGTSLANGVLHRIQVDADGTGNFLIALIDGSDASDVITASFSNPGSIGGSMGFCRSGAPAGIGLFDNLIVTVPEPATLVLLALGGLGVLARRKRRQAFPQRGL